MTFIALVAFEENQSKETSEFRRLETTYIIIKYMLGDIMWTVICVH